MVHFRVNEKWVCPQFCLVWGRQVPVPVGSRSLEASLQPSSPALQPFCRRTDQEQGGNNEGLGNEGDRGKWVQGGWQDKTPGVQPIRSRGLIPPPISGIPSLPKTPHQVEGAADHLALRGKKKSVFHGFPFLACPFPSSSASLPIYPNQLCHGQSAPSWREGWV